MKKLLPLLSVLSLLLLAGCQAPTTAGMSTRINAVGGNDEFAARVRYDDTRMASSLQVLGAATRQNPDGFIIAQVEVQNLSKRNYPVQYLFSWFDQNGMEIYPGKRPWQQKVLFGGEIANLQGVSPYPEAVEFKINFRNIP
jgi:uncharacterized protein YcfL